MAFPGLYRGTVINAVDPLARGRLQVTVPGVGGNTPMWAERCAPLGAPAGGRGGGAVGGQVWVMFEQGDPAFPVVIGTRA
jgi:hypothetical protein